jgi:hypothetical protein
MGAIMAERSIVVSDTGVVTEMPLVDALLEPYAEGLGAFYWGYRAHCYRVLNWARFVSDPAPHREEKLALMAVPHDLPFLLNGDLDYLGAACDLASAKLAELRRTEWEEEVHAMINHHHKVRRYTGEHAALVEACRKADWIDVSFTKLHFGIPRPIVREVSARFPFNEAYKNLGLPAIGRYARRHLSRPLPMMRW